VVGNAEEFGTYLRKRDFHVAVFVQHFIYNRYAPYFRTLLPECRLVFDALDLEHVRCEREAEILNTKDAHDNAARVKREEIGALRDADAVWTVTEVEKQNVLGFVPNKHVDVIPTIHEAGHDLPGFDAREAIVFLGNYQHRPNVDAIHYFMREIFPSVTQSLPDVPFLIAGSYPDESLFPYEKQWPDVHVTGYVEDHRALLKSCRVGIAPLRYGAGMKGKIGEYLGCGLPCVSTSIGSEGMGLTNEREVLVADDPQDFASCITQLYSDPDLWQRVACAGAAYINTFSFAAVAPRVEAAIQAASLVTRTKRTASLGNLSAILRRPGEAARWIGTAGRAFRRGGVRELLRQFRVWLHRPTE
jgi:glycosyltransferase involved in cell wall biosynthesis